MVLLFAVACGLTAAGFLISLFVPSTARAKAAVPDAAPDPGPGGGAEPAGTLDPA